MLFFYSVSEIEQKIETSLRTEPTTVDDAVGHLFVRLVGIHFIFVFSSAFFFFSVSIINRKMYLCRSKEEEEEEDSDAGETVEEKEDEEEEAASQHDLASWQLSCGMLQQTERQTDREADRQRGGQTDRGKPVAKSSVESGCPNTQPNRTVAGAEQAPNPPDKATFFGVGVVLPDFAVTLKNLWNLFSLILSFLFDKKES